MQTRKLLKSVYPNAGNFFKPPNLDRVSSVLSGESAIHYFRDCDLKDPAPLLWRDSSTHDRRREVDDTLKG